MTDLKMFVGFLKITEEVASDLGLSDLTPSDRMILTILWEKYAEQPEGFSLLFDQFSESCEKEGISISSQFLASGLIKKLGGDRSHRYMFLDA
ncbi:MAG: hypothetical protein EBR12_03605 [Proteobacteria bacterium]|nr:hypothetical protein [Pseudomonadota bacterium]